MTLTINGVEKEIADTILTVEDLIHFFDWGHRVVIVEVNQTILTKDQHGSTTLRNGDQVEIVSFVGGG
ncbi:sulfur carrier protein ThiS [Hazenella sp. IB182357]|uniref:Sulfur carrier protein ThiS n=1 Tax=Polycladospora coralii TaxID=2771432 RepID=A0A926N5T5_9BACL|nr:sulfur carrier protein ThiS [Polycladospora coralii]MBD1372079.1 sulfur carrier protein ThiS [Polycladospora coralii]MBS7530585.1 sulfur carrier protein ThiS [Polycladospora coralii]